MPRKHKGEQWMSTLLLGLLALFLCASVFAEESLVIRGEHILQVGTKGAQRVLETVNFEMTSRTNGDWRIKTTFTNGLVQTISMVGGTPYYLTTVGANGAGVGRVMRSKDALLASATEAARLIYTACGQDILPPGFPLPIPFFEPLSPYLRAYSWAPQLHAFPPYRPRIIRFVVNRRAPLTSPYFGSLEWPAVKRLDPSPTSGKEFARSQASPPVYVTLSWTNVNDLTLPLEGALTYVSPHDGGIVRRTSSFTVKDISTTSVRDLKPTLPPSARITHVTSTGYYKYINTNSTWLTEAEAKEGAVFVPRLQIVSMFTSPQREWLPIAGIILCLLYSALRLARAVMTRNGEPRETWFVLTHFRKSRGSFDETPIGMSPIRAGPFVDSKPLSE